jgi:hypothetical protein
MKRNCVFVLMIAGLSFTAGATFGGKFFPEAVAQIPARTVKSSELLRKDLGSFCEGKEVVVSINENGSGTSRRHFHPGHSFGYTISGSEMTTIDGEKPTAGVAGEARHEGPGEIQESITSAPETVLWVRILEKGKELTTYVP